MHHGRLTKDIAAGLAELRSRIAKAKIPSSQLDQCFNLATWNVREFGKKRRSKASLHYIAEILNEFDLIAITELRDDVRDLAEVMTILGPYWRVVYSDFITDPAGNRERIGYLYDTRMMEFTGLAAEADPPRKKARSGEYLPTITWWRAPYLASFRAGNFDFILLTAHIRWGSGAAVRLGPIQQLAEWVDVRRTEKGLEDKDVIVMGDFNIPSTRSKLFTALTAKGLKLPAALTGAHGSNLAKDKRYDQIVHYATHPERFTNRGGVLDFYAGDHKPLYPGTGLSKDKFTYELSDHLPLWIQIDSDIEGERLDQILNPPSGK